MSRVERACAFAHHPAAVSHLPSTARRLMAEAIGTAFLLAAVVGSVIMGERLAGGNVGLAMLANAGYRCSTSRTHLDVRRHLGRAVQSLPDTR